MESDANTQWCLSVAIEPIICWRLPSFQKKPGHRTAGKGHHFCRAIYVELQSDMTPISGNECSK